MNSDTVRSLRGSLLTDMNSEFNQIYPFLEWIRTLGRIVIDWYIWQE